MGTALGVALGLLVAVVVFVVLAMDAGRYRWATELIGRSIDWVVRRARALVTTGSGPKSSGRPGRRA